MSAFILKLLAMSTMLIDHISIAFLNNYMPMRNVGRLAFITYAFLMAEAFYHLRQNPPVMKRHILKLSLLCLITEIPFDYFEFHTWYDWTAQSVLPTLTLGYAALVLSDAWFQETRSKTLSIIGSVATCLIAAITTYKIYSEYVFGGVLLIVMFYLYLRKADEMNLPMRLICLELICTEYLIVYIWARADFGNLNTVLYTLSWFKEYCPGIILSFIPLAFYNRELGYYKKWFSVLYSLFYPLQFVVLAIVRDVFM